jgi:hypothetical protein
VLREQSGERGVGEAGADRSRSRKAAPTSSTPSLDPRALAAGDVLRLQRASGNGAVSALLGGTMGTAPVGGLDPDATPEKKNKLVGGVRSFGEAVGDVFRPVGSALGNAAGSVAGALGGASVSSTSNSGPTWNNHGHFDWRVGFTTSARSGWLVQEIVNTFRGEDSTGAAITTSQPTPRYFEAWSVSGAGAVTPNVGPNNDYWIRPSRGANTKGHWTMTGTVYHTETDPATQGFTAGGVANAGILLSTTNQPTGLGVARLHRYAQGTWDSTGAAPTHTGSAGP